MASTETLIDRIDGFIDSLDEHVTHEDMANALASLRELVQASCQHDWQNRVAGGSKCQTCNVWQDKRVAENASAPTDDEWDALTRIVRDVHLYDGGPDHAMLGMDASRIARAILAEGFRRSEVPEPEMLAPGESSACTGCGCPRGSDATLSAGFWCGHECHAPEPQGETSNSEALLAIRDDIVRNGGRADAAVLAGIERLAARAAGGVR